MRCLLVLAAVTAAPALGACRGAAAVGPAEAAGTYRLESVSGQPLSIASPAALLAGTLVLEADGGATRRLEYAAPVRPSGATVLEARGTFQVRRDSVLLALVEDPSRPEVVWRPAAARQGTVLVVRFPHPADGPDIVERYRRE